MSRKPILFLALLLALPVWGAAQNPPTPPPAPPAAQAAAPVVIGPAKVAFVDIQQAITLCDEGKKESAILQQYVDQKSQELQKMQKELEGLRNQLELTGSKLNDDARQDLADAIESKDTQVQRFQQDTQKDIDSRRQKLQNTIARKMLTSIEKVAKEKGANVVQFLGITNIYGYVDPSLVITEDVVKAYNIAYPAAAVSPAVKK
ncbi:MAG: OmpH family outer membrane protein [Acidobacteriia bacterium]|nr:OmpH family outer membrane protein [Terriglobia bacterium]